MLVMNHIRVKGMCAAAAIIGFVSVVSRGSGILPPDPNNAALLYYQAVLLCPDLDDATKDMLRHVSYGAELTEGLKDYVEQCRDATRYVETATQMSRCDWGIRYSLGLKYVFPPRQSLLLLSQVLHAEARTLAENGDYRAALQRCLTIRQLAKHVGNDLVDTYSLAMDIERQAQRGICQILGSMRALDAETIAWLQGQLNTVTPVSLSPAKASEMYLSLALQSLRTRERTMESVRRQLADADNDAARNAKDLPWEELLGYLERPYRQFLDSALPVIDGDRPYEEGYAEIQKLIRDMEEQVNRDPVGRIVAKNIAWIAHPVVVLYNAKVRNTARLNALSVALALYLEKARSGQLPRGLPRNLAKDPYTQKDFLYSITETGFALRSPVQPQDGSPALVLECTVR